MLKHPIIAVATGFPSNRADLWYLFPLLYSVLEFREPYDKGFLSHCK